MFAAGKDGKLVLLVRGAAPNHLVPVYGQAPYLPASASTSGGACSGLNPYVGPYYLTTMTLQGIPIGANISQSSVGTASSSSSIVARDRDSIEDYPEIRGSNYWDPMVEGHLISMLALAPSGNSSGRYPTIRRSEPSDAWMPDDRLVRIMNLNFNVVRLQIIMESIQHMAPDGSPLVALAQQGAKAANFIIAERLVGNPRGEPYVDN
jgi:hypothetical protein